MDSNSLNLIPQSDAPPLDLLDDERPPPQTPIGTLNKSSSPNLNKNNIPPRYSSKKMSRGSYSNSRHDDDTQSEWSCGSWFEYLLIVVLSTILLIGVLVLTLFWVLFYRGGFAWNENTELQFNLHPTLMVAGFVTLSGFSILLYRLCRCLKHIYVKLFHMLFHACAAPCIALGFYSVFESYSLSEPPKQHFYSLHTWLGLVTMGLFVLQFVVGFFSFLILLCCEKKTLSCRSVMVPLHASFGLANFMLAIATCITGLIEKERKILATETQSSTENSIIEHYIMNAIGIVLIALGIIVTFAVRRSNAPSGAKVIIRERI